MCSVCSTMVSAASMQVEVRAALASMGGERNGFAMKCVTIKDTVHTRVIVKGH